MIGTMGVLITLLLSDRDLWRWLNLPDIIVWVFLALLNLVAQISGAMLAVHAAKRSDQPRKLVGYLVTALLAITLQMGTCVYSSLVLDLKLIKLM